MCSGRSATPAAGGGPDPRDPPGSPGLKALLDVQAFTGHRDLPVRVVAADNRHATRPLQITGLDKVLNVRRSVDEALQEFGCDGNVH